MLLMVKSVVFAGAFLLAMVMLGTLVLHIAGWKKTVIGAAGWGFIAVLGIFQVIAYPLYKMNASFSALFWIFSAVLLALLAASAAVIVREKQWRAASGEIKTLWTNFRQTPLPVLVLLVMTVLFLVFGLFFYSGPVDDSYYMPRAMEVISRNTLGVSHSVGWFGTQVDAFHETTDASTLEFFKAYLSRLTGVQVTLLCRNHLQIALLLLVLASAWTFTDTFAAGKEHAFSIKVYALILCIALLLLDFHRGTSSWWVSNMLWQGKSMLPGMVIPLLFAGCGNIMQHIESFKFREWLPIALVLLCGVSVSIVGLILTPILYFLLGVSFLLVTKFRHFGRIAPCAVVSVLPVLAIVALSYFNVATENAQYFTVTEQDRSWAGDLWFSTDKFAFLLFLACVVYLLFKGSKLERALFVVMPALHFATFANPILRPIVASYVTTHPVYFRIFWILPVVLLSAYVIPTVLLRFLQPKGLQTALVGVCVSLSLYTGSQWSVDGVGGLLRALLPVSSTAYIRANEYRILRDNYEIATRILADWQGEERPVLLLYDNDYDQDEIRQYTEKINLACGMRKGQVDLLTDCIPGTQTTLAEFYESYHEIADGAYLHDMLTRMDIDYICFHDRTAVEDPESCGFTPMYEGDHLMLWRVDAS